MAAVPGVYECAAAAVAHPEAGEALVLYIVPQANGDSLAEGIRRSLPIHWTCIPSAWSPKFRRPTTAR